MDYLSPLEVHSYSKEQILYILNNCLDGNWPTKESGYNDAPISKSSSQHMPGETALIVVAEVKVRIGMCGDSGRRLYDAFLHNQTGRGLDFDDLSTELRQVVSYVSGTCRKWVSCDNCPKAVGKEVAKLLNIKRGRKPCTFNMWVNHNR